MILRVSIAIVVSIVYLFIGPIVACLVTDEYDDFCFKIMLAIFWPITLIICFVLLAEPVYKFPRKIANRLKKIFKKDKEDN